MVVKWHASKVSGMQVAVEDELDLSLKISDLHNEVLRNADSNAMTHCHSKPILSRYYLKTSTVNLRSF